MQNYIENAPKIRLQNLVWIIVNQEILIIGTPILPIQGKTFWNNLDFIFPSGYDLEFPILNQIINLEINPFNENFIFYQENGTYFNIPKDYFKPLSISSFRLTFSN